MNPVVILPASVQCFEFFSMLWQYWFGDRRGVQLVKNLCELYPKILLWKRIKGAIKLLCVVLGVVYRC